MPWRAAGAGPCFLISRNGSRRGNGKGSLSRKRASRWKRLPVPGLRTNGRDSSNAALISRSLTPQAATAYASRPRGCATWPSSLPGLPSLARSKRPSSRSSHPAKSCKTRLAPFATNRPCGILSKAKHLNRRGARQPDGGKSLAGPCPELAQRSQEGARESAARLFETRQDEALLRDQRCCQNAISELMLAPSRALLRFGPG